MANFLYAMTVNPELRYLVAEDDWLVANLVNWLDTDALQGAWENIVVCLVRLLRIDPSEGHAEHLYKVSSNSAWARSIAPAPVLPHCPTAPPPHHPAIPRCKLLIKSGLVQVLMRRLEDEDWVKQAGTMYRNKSRYYQHPYHRRRRRRNCRNRLRNRNRNRYHHYPPPLYLLSPIHYSRSPYGMDTTPSAIGLDGLVTPDAPASGPHVTGIGRSPAQQIKEVPPPMNVADFHFHEHVGMKTRLLNCIGLVSHKHVVQLP